MNRTITPFAKKFAAFTIAFLLIALPTIIVAAAPQSYTPLTQVLFDILLLGVSIWIGKLLSDEEVARAATAKWLPAAEMVCNELLTMSATTERLCRKQSSLRESIHEVFPSMPKDTLSPIERFVHVRCGHCSEGLENLKNHIENSFNNWALFININCDEQECQKIFERLKKRREELFTAVERDFPNSAV
jgi:hypothetical protein